MLQQRGWHALSQPVLLVQERLFPISPSADAARWWLSKRRYLIDEIGIDGFKTDGSEHLAGRGSDQRMVGAATSWSMPTRCTTSRLPRLARKHRNGDALTFSRAGHTGAGAFPAHWAGDENSTWEAYRRLDHRRPDGRPQRRHLLGLGYRRL